MWRQHVIRQKSYFARVSRRRFVQAAVCAAGSALTLAVVNRDRDRSHRAAIDLGGARVAGGIEVAEVTGSSVDATNSFEHPDAVGVSERRVDAEGGAFEHEFPARSLSVLRLRLA